MFLFLAGILIAAGFVTAVYFADNLQFGRMDRRAGPIPFRLDRALDRDGRSNRRRRRDSRADPPPTRGHPAVILALCGVHSVYAEREDSRPPHWNSGTACVVESDMPRFTRGRFWNTGWKPGNRGVDVVHNLSSGSWSPPRGG